MLNLAGSSRRPKIPEEDECSRNNEEEEEELHRKKCKFQSFGKYIKMLKMFFLLLFLFIALKTRSAILQWLRLMIRRSEFWFHIGTCSSQRHGSFAVPIAANNNSGGTRKCFRNPVSTILDGKNGFIDGDRRSKVTCSYSFSCT